MKRATRVLVASVHPNDAIGSSARRGQQMFKKLKRWISRPSDPSGHVYYARLATPQGTFYKIGYTTKTSLAERLNFQGCGDHRFIDREFFFTYRRDAWDVEQQLLEHFEKRLAFGRFSKDPAFPLCGRGQGELFRYDVLGLDEEIYKVELDTATMEQRKSFTENMNASFWMIIIGLILLPFTLGWSLLLIAGGIAGFFGSSHDRPPSQVSRRPVHPQFIQSLIEALSKRTKRTQADGRSSVDEDLVASYVDEARAERLAKIASRTQASLKRPMP